VYRTFTNRLHLRCSHGLSSGRAGWTTEATRLIVVDRTRPWTSRGLRGLLMASITNLIRGTGREYFDLFERAGANVARAGELLDQMLAGFPDTHGLAEEILVCEAEGDQITHDLIRRMNETFVTPIDR